jgi:DNA-binding transcriptional LysR family regulator
MDHLESMRTFCRVAEFKSFTRAARHLDISTPVVSRQVGALEKHLGIRLLNRSTRQVELSEAGERYYQSCVELLDRLDSVESEITGIATRPSGLLRISVPLDFGLLFLQPKIREFLSREPAVRVEVHFEDRKVKLLDENIDVAIRIGHLKDSSMIARKLGVAFIACYASPDYLAINGEPQRPEDLSHHRVLEFALSSHHGKWEFGDDKCTVDINTQWQLSSNNGRALARAACQGMGIVRLPEFLVQGHLQKGRLIEVLRPYRSNPLEITIVYLQRKFNPAKISMFAYFLVDQFRQEKNWLQWESDSNA